MSVNARGFSLPETLIAMAIGSVLLLGTARFLPALQQQVLKQSQQNALDNELWQRLYAIAKHLQRAGYCLGSCVGQPLYIAGSGDCVIVRWDSASDGVWNTSPEAMSDATGFRLRNGALETRRGTESCGEQGWERMTNPGAIEVTRFQVLRHNITGFAPEISILLAARSTLDPRITAQAEYSVTGYNL